MELEILLIRHGESQYNRDGGGGFDSALTDLGIEQARRLGPWLAANKTIDALYSSPMVRACQTAELIAPHLQLPIQFESDIVEADFDIALSLKQFPNAPSSIGEQIFTLEQMTSEYIAFQSRIVNAFRRMIGTRERGTIAVVTHGGVIATLVRSIFGAHQVSVYADNTGLALLRWRNGRWYLVYSNCVEHLPREMRSPDV